MSRVYPPQTPFLSRTYPPVTIPSGGAAWQRVGYASLVGIGNTVLAQGDEFNAGGITWRYDTSGASAVFTLDADGLVITRAGAGNHAGFLTTSVPSDIDPYCPLAILVEVTSANIGGGSNVGGWFGRIQPGPLFGPSWQAGVRASDYYARTGNDSDFQLASLTGGTRPNAPLRAGCLIVPEIGVTPIAAEDATLPLVDPTTGVSRGSAANSTITQTISAVDRWGLVSFLTATTTIRVTGIGLYQCIK